jgi:hypothetical protein
MIWPISCSGQPHPHEAAGMDPREREQFAVRCIVVSTEAAVASLGRSYASNSALRDRLQREARERGLILLAQLQADSEPMSQDLSALMQTARARLDL